MNPILKALLKFIFAICLTCTVDLITVNVLTVKQLNLLVFVWLAANFLFYLAELLIMLKHLGKQKKFLKD